MLEITNDIKYVGVNDHQIDLFEGQYKVPNGMSYNSYAIIDEKIAIMDSVDQNFGTQWLENIDKVLNGKTPDFLIVQHMEPDHCANIPTFMNKYPQAKIISNEKAFNMMKNFFGTNFADKQIVVKENDKFSLGKHELTFIFAPLVHWPEVMMTYDITEQVFFSADAFGKFGALDIDEPWDDEAARYYIGIVGKYGMPVQNLFKKIANVSVKTICPLHGPVLKDNLSHYLNLYQKWSSYQTEKDGILVAFTSVYGHTKQAATLLAETLKSKGQTVVLLDLARTDMAEAVADAFRYGKIVLATTTYNGDFFPFMREFINDLTERGFQNKTVGFIENGSWAPVAARKMKALLEPCKNLTFVEPVVTITSAMNDNTKSVIQQLADAISK